MSARRFMTDLRDAQMNGHVSRTWHFNSVLKVLENPDIEPTIHRLIRQLAAPLGAVETQFAVDSTGFGTQKFYRHFTAKYGREQVFRNYVKLHALVDTKTTAIAAASVTDRDRNDYTQSAPLAPEGAKKFATSEISADKAYIGRSNLNAVAAIGAEPFIPFKGHMTDNRRHPCGRALSPVPLPHR